ncbi:hypothetical protein [uncultured Duncaniella sp.]|jgi:hypothetical protein|uniref:hypothetical protein n=2 Tax=uncultured Duncaniella sp. TaxID=2768039 RepID=UPI00265A6D8B|nr:hypothetical protein [uncultured Duncaniella sp.]
MTDAEKDAVWRSLPDGFKKEVSRHYKSWHNTLAFGGECAVLDYIFGKHNLTASEEEKPKSELKHGEIVIPVRAEYDDSIWLACRMELAKELAVAAMSRKGCIDINELMDDVDGIVERLKGGKNEISYS